jgi:O-antigen/teichoic acid export membrane protein
MTCLAFGLALIGLWWREFVRQIQFARMHHEMTLKIYATYCLATVVLILAVLATGNFTTTSALWCMGIGGVIATALPIIAATRQDTGQRLSYRESLSMSWQMGRWEVLGSILTWGYAQSYVYFAALHGGLDAAAEVSAGRLLATPLSLMWASYANVLRPSTSKLFAYGLHRDANQLAIRSAAFVVGSSLLYAMAIYALIPFVNQKLFGGKFQQLQSLSMWWIGYAAMTGLSTVASSLLRSAMKFRQVFTRQLASSVVALVLLTTSLNFKSIASIVIAMIAVEAFSACMLWRRMRVAIHEYSLASSADELPPRRIGAET